MTPSTTLHDEQQLMSLMLTLLKQEQASLVDAHADGVAEVTQQKSDVIARLGELARQRHRALGKAGFPAEEAGMDAWIAASGEPHIADAWAALLDTTREAKELNRINGMLKIGRASCRERV